MAARLKEEQSTSISTTLDCKIKGTCTIIRLRCFCLHLKNESDCVYILCTMSCVYVSFFSAGEGGGVLPYMGYIGMCHCEGYGFQAVYSRIRYINQSVWVQNRVSVFTKLTSWLKIISTLRKPGIATQIIYR